METPTCDSSRESILSEGTASVIPDDTFPKRTTLGNEDEASRVPSLAEHSKAAQGSEAAEPPSSPSKHGQPQPYSIFSRRQKAFLVAMAAWSASFSGISSNIYFPALSQISSNLGVSIELANLTVTLYLIFQGLSPSFWAPISDRLGRRLVILSTFIVYLGACVGLGLTRSFAQLAVLRCVQSTGSASSVAIGAGIVGDIASREERGGYMGIFSAGLLLSTAVGPVIGGAMAETVGWRAIFWFLTAYAGVFIAMVAVFLPETLRSLVGNGSVAPASPWMLCPAQRLWTPTAADIERSPRLAGTTEEKPSGKPKLQLDFLLRPVKLIFRGNVSLSVFYLAIHYSIWQMTITAMSSLFASSYGLTEMQIGITYIANGGGCILGSLFIGKVLDVDYARVEKRSEARRQPVNLAKARLRLTWIYSLVQGGSTIVFGWTIARRVHISVPIIVTFLISASSTSIQTAVNTYLVDTNPSDAASVTASLNLARCLLGAGATAAVAPIIRAIGAGWTFTIATCVLVVSNAIILAQLRLQRTKPKIRSDLLA
ncbi:MFS general substrate transporter [Violaceomyces palustris]|uniref:MFS general substrate transporter n=1 Tax=Violaceomyces palustris TaxID=1673888 RepID=A0ACD0NPX3_9BASI|nr:MFS general substrate transporter [Violaceomyces palustris]